MFCVHLPVSVQHRDGDFDALFRTSVDLVYRGGRWRAQCTQPPVTTEFCSSFDEALIAVAKDIAAEVAAASVEAPQPPGECQAIETLSGQAGGDAGSVDSPVSHEGEATS